MILANVIDSFIVMATVIKIINYDRTVTTVITIITYNPKTFIVQATGRAFKWLNEGRVVQG
jgi:hypothetical protein